MTTNCLMKSQIKTAQCPMKSQTTTHGLHEITKVGKIEKQDLIHQRKNLEGNGKERYKKVQMLTETLFSLLEQICLRKIL